MERPAAAEDLLLEETLAQLRAAASSQGGGGWLRQQLAGILPGSAAVADSPPADARPRRRSMPPLRLTDQAASASLRRRSPARDPPARPPPAKQPKGTRGRGGRNPGRQQRQAEAGRRPAAGHAAGPSPSSSSEATTSQEMAAPQRGMGEPASRKRRQAGGAGEGCPSVRSAVSAIGDGQRSAGPATATHEDPDVRRAGSYTCSQPAAGQREDAPGCSSWDDRQDSGYAAGGAETPAQLGEYSSICCESTQIHTQEGGLGVHWGGNRTLAGRGEGYGGGEEVRELLDGVRALLERYEGGGPQRREDGPSPVAAWVSEQETGAAWAAAGYGEFGEAARELVPVGARSAVAVQTDGGREERQVADSARGEVYVCFDGPLGAHLKQDIKNQIWKDEYVEIFSLLPLERFHLERLRRDEFRREEEEKRRWRLIPQTFQNWLQAFAILASVIGEKRPDNCSALFCYMEGISEAHRVFGGQAWLRYDEQFRQRKAVRPNLRWDHKDMILWLRMMGPGRPGPPFLGGAGWTGPGMQGTTNFQGTGGGSQRSGYCWQFNTAQCRFGPGCRFKHACNACGGSTHGASRCYRRAKGRGQGPSGQGGDPGQAQRDGAFPR